jgi:hypothetical protein
MTLANRLKMNADKAKANRPKAAAKRTGTRTTAASRTKRST